MFGEERGEARGCLTPNPGACKVSSSSMKFVNKEEEEPEEPEEPEEEEDAENDEEGDEGGREEDVDPQGRLCSSQGRLEVNFAASFSLHRDPRLLDLFCSSPRGWKPN